MQVKFPFFIIATAGFLISSCSKTDIKNNPTPAGTDTVVTIKPDSSSLLKQTTTFDFATDGVSVLDSNQLQWKYDNQRRITQAIFSGAGYQDTGTYTYSVDRDIISSVAYLNGTLALVSIYTTYHHMAGITDSITVHNTGYGAQAGEDNMSSVYFYYNQNGQDSIEKSYSMINNVSTFTSSVSYYYTTAVKDSVVGRDPQGTTSYINYYTDGNESSSTTYYNGVPVSMVTISYTNISSGPLAVWFNATKLESGTFSVNLSSNQTYKETVTYQFDAQNRVSVVLRAHYGTSPDQKQTFSYY